METFVYDYGGMFNLHGFSSLIRFCLCLLQLYQFNYAVTSQFSPRSEYFIIIRSSEV